MTTRRARERLRQKSHGSAVSAGWSQEDELQEDTTGGQHATMAVTYTPLDVLTREQLDKILARFQLVSPHNRAEDKISLIRCIGLFDTKFRQYENANILVGFNRTGNLHEIKSDYEAVKLFESTCTCNQCGRNVDNKEIGMRCSTCNQYFHNRCTSSPMDTPTFNHIANTPDWVKVHCPKCMEATNKSEKCLEDIKETILKKLDDTNQAAKNVPYSTVLSRNIESNMKQTNKLVGDLVRRQAAPEKEEEKKEKNERSLIVKKYMDKNIQNSSDIRKIVNQEFKEVAIRNARTTVAGSILLEFEDKNAAETVKHNWKPTLFGGNKGIVNLKAKPAAAGFIKHVYQDIPEADIKAEVEAQFPNSSEVELFKKDKKFTGSIKVNFNSEEDLNAAKEKIVVINRQRYIMEKFNYQPRLIRCFNCHKFGHVARLCRLEGTICGKCTSNEHKTKDCTSRIPQYKCFLCDGNHETGNKNCDIIKFKTEELYSGQWL